MGWFRRATTPTPDVKKTMQTAHQLPRGPMVYQTVKSMAKKLEVLASHDVPVSRSFDLLAAHARTIEELVVVEVMRECAQEMTSRQGQSTADSAARTPAMALSR